MRKKVTKWRTSLEINQSYQAEPLCQKLKKIINEKGKIDDSAPIVYTNKKDGVLPAYDIRTDRFEVARKGVEQLGKYYATKAAQNENTPTGNSEGGKESGD